MSYRVLVLPNVQTMTPALLDRVKELVEAGAVVVGPRPLKSPSLSDYPNCDTQVRRIARNLWGDATASGPAQERAVGKGKIVQGNRREAVPDATGTPLYGDYPQVAELLARMGVPPDFESDAPVRYTHRRDGETDIYFVANRDSVPIEALCTFRVAGRVPQIWDPVSGDILSQDVYEEKDGRTRLTLSLEPRQSVFVVFQRKPFAAGQKGKWRSAGQVIAEVSGPWEVRFQPGRGGPEKVTFDTLLDWSKHPDRRVRYFSGEATYTTTVRIPAERLGSGRRLKLDLGRIEVMARVKLNGRDFGVLWTPPFRVDVTDAARDGDNVLEITVANLWPNRLIGDQSLPPADRVAWTTWNPFRGDSPLLESGLLGPVIMTASD
ncbi:MAG: glycosyl hydrolase, partial [Planctomycetes bacterium]|nr:glycosyl hydrolase [Planctomycetota bacterium]